MAKRGPPKTVIDWQTVDAMLKIQCTGEEIASVLDIDYDTLQNACKRDHKMKFSEYSAKKRLGGRASLRRMQWKKAESGDSTLLIWLGKNILNQSDKTNLGDEEAQPINIKVDVINASKPKLSSS